MMHNAGRCARVFDCAGIYMRAQDGHTSFCAVAIQKLRRAYSDVDLRNDTRNLLSLHTDVGANLSDFETASFFATLFKSDWVNLRFSSHVM